VSRKMPRPVNSSGGKCVLSTRTQINDHYIHIPLLPNTGPGWARSFVSHMASPSPKRWEESPVTLNSTSMTKLVDVRARRDHSHPC